MPGGVEIYRIGRLAAIDAEAVVASEIECFSLEQIRHVGHTLINPLQEPFENFARRAGLSGGGQIVQHSPILVEFFQVGLEELHVQAIEFLQVAVEEFG